VHDVNTSIDGGRVAVRRNRFWVPLVVVVLVAVGVVGYRLWPRTAPPVYVTDGSHVFNANLRGVENLIHGENDWVTGTGRPSVGIAVLTPSGVSPAAQRHAVEGAYLAQYAANHPGGPKARPGVPLVRLLVAVDGPGTAAALAAANVVAVAGPGGADLVADLAALHIPVIGTGDAGTVRVRATAAEQAQAAVRLLGAAPRVWLIEDQHGGDAPGAFLLALRSRHRQLVGPGSEYDSGVSLTALTDTGTAVCHARANVVYFAGPGADLRTALAGLARRSCARGRHLMVIAGSDATQAAGRALWPAATGNMDVYVTGLAHPGMWSRQPSAADPATTAWFRTLPYGFGHMFPGDGAALQDGWAILSHDAVQTAVDAVREAPTVGAATPAPAAVGQTLGQVTVHGAGGYLCFDDAGDPIDRVIPIEQLSPAGALTYRGVSPGAGNPCG
jgi:hypothetical protein